MSRLATVQLSSMRNCSKAAITRRTCKPDEAFLRGAVCGSERSHANNTPPSWPSPLDKTLHIGEALMAPTLLPRQLSSSCSPCVSGTPAGAASWPRSTFPLPRRPCHLGWWKSSHCLCCRSRSCSPPSWGVLEGVLSFCPPFPSEIVTRPA